jgi:hypothetical protein
MKDIALEFGLLIAYAIPGAFALFGVSTFVPELALMLSQPDDQKWLSSALLMAGLSIALGMFVSVLRSLTVDASFLLRLPSAGPKRPHWLPVERVDPDYGSMKAKDVLAALQDVRSTDKRPYQFYGNMLVALAILEASRLTQSKAVAAEIAISVAVGVAFYLASRKSHFRYMQAVRALNSKDV